MLRNATRLFKPLYHSTQIKKANDFVLNVVQGKQQAVKAQLQANPALISMPGTATDFSRSKRTFRDYTGFQCALWALDWHMWKMMLPYLSLEERQAQVHDLMTKKTEHGPYYDFDKLIYPIEVYLANFDSWTCEQLGVQWCKGIGEELADAPAHVGNEICHPHRSFLPTPSFTEDELPRTFDIINDVKYFPLKRYSAGVMGIDFAPFRWSNKTAGVGTMKPCPNARVSAETDLAALKRLKEVRLAQRAELIQTLSFKPTRK